MTNEDLAHLIDRNHEDAKQRFNQLESRMDAVESEMVTHAELDELMTSREALIVKAIDDRMIYYGRRAIALIGTPVGIWILNRIWEVL